MIQRTVSLLLIFSLLSGCEFEIPDPTEEEIVQAAIECPPLRGMIKDFFATQTEPRALSGITFALLKDDCLETEEYIKYKNQKVLDALEPIAENADK